MYQLILLSSHILSIAVPFFFRLSQFTTTRFQRARGLLDWIIWCRPEAGMADDVPSAKQSPVNRRLITDIP